MLMVSYRPVSKSNMSSQIADQIEQMILSMKLKAGEKLPGEIELAQRFGASRNVLREAMTALKERGLIEVKNGSGAYVLKPDADALDSVVNRLLAFGATSIYEVYEIRMALEVRACSLAAKFADEQDIERLHTLVEEMEQNYRDDALWTKYDMEFHEALAQMTRVSLFPVFLKPLITSVQSIFKSQPQPLSARESGLAAHKKIVAAIEAKDRHLAEEAMTSHLKGFLTDVANIMEQKPGEIT